MFPRFIFFNLLLFASYSWAESVKYLQWWDEYLPTREELATSLSYRGDYVVTHHLDLNDDGIENDTRICKPLKIDTPFNPVPMCPRDFNWANYREDRPSGRFYGAFNANFINTSSLKTTSYGKEVYAIRKLSQPTVQNDGASPNLYSTKYPHNIARALNRYSDIFWADMTLFVVDPNWTQPAKAFYSVDDASTNFSAFFLWKKEDFVNGGASADNIVFDATSSLKIDLTRHWKNMEDARFIVQEGEQMWISEYVFDELTSGYIISLNPLDSRWAKYNPQDCDLAINTETIKFVEHEFTDVQGAGAYFARYTYMPSDQEPQNLAFIFDNFQLFATNNPTDAPSKRSIPSVDVKVAPSFAFDEQLQAVMSETLFSIGSAVNGGLIQAYASDQLDIRGVITPQEEHIDKQADIIVVIGYLPNRDADLSELQTFLLNSKGMIASWNGSLEGLAALEMNVTLTPEYRVQLFPVSIERFKNYSTMDSVVLGCDERPITYTGVIGQPGVYQFYYGYMLEYGELVYSQQPITIELLPDPEPPIDDAETDDSTDETGDAETDDSTDETG
ncbi:MAG: hypothetical protein VSS52_012635, partial [Thiotrichaceae bacterium]|nr:hypothetical protein [Thiotrichaceae bacterium]